jgi:uncharacterized protein GlcG (DUF336 family)
MTITLEDANRVASAAVLKASEISERISVSVCDPYGHLVAHQRMNGVLGDSSRASIGKAVVAAETKRPTGDALSDFRGLATAAGMPECTLCGGLPIIRNGELEGAIGVAGGLTDEQDKECAQAAIASLKAAS